MQKTRFVALLLAFVMLGTVLLTGCNQTPVETQPKETTPVKPSETQGNQTEPAPTEKELEPVTLKFWIAQKKTEDSDMVIEAVNEYLKDVLPNTTIEVTWIPMNNQWRQNWSQAMASGESIDLSWFGYLNSVETEITMGSLMPIDDLLAEYGSGIIETLGEVTVERHRSSDGQLYFIPAWQGMYGNRQGIYFRQENVDLMGEGWAEKFQAQLYETWDQPWWNVDAKLKTVSYIEDLLKASQDAGKLGLGFYVRSNPIIRLFNSNGKQLENELVHVTVVGDTYYVEADSSLTSPSYYQTQVFHDWYQKGYIREDVLSVDLGDAHFEKSTANDQEYMNMIQNAWTDSEHLTHTDRAGEQIAQFNIQKDGELTDGFATGAVIPATAENPERAMMFLELLYTDAELYQLLVYGIEGVHYTTYKNGTISYPEKKTYTGPYNWAVGTCINALQTLEDKLTYYADLKEMEETAKISFMEGFIFNQEPISVEFSNLKAVYTEYRLVGMAVEEDWEKVYTERRDKMIAAGMETYINEYVKQLTEFAAAKGMKVELIGY